MSFLAKSPSIWDILVFSNFDSEDDDDDGDDDDSHYSSSSSSLNEPAIDNIGQLNGFIS